jgi:hypothetical protein
VHFWFSCAEIEPAAFPAASVARDAPGVARYRFQDSSAILELVIGEIQPELPTNMTVAGCRAALWRIAARRGLSRLRFRAEWPDPTGRADGTPNPGEHLDAFTWRLADSMLSLGTEDGEALAVRAELHEGVPARLSGQLTYSTVEYTSSGMVVPIAELYPGERLEIHFLVAWAHGVSEESPATWFAVEQKHREVVRMLHIRGVLQD